MGPGLSQPLVGSHRKIVAWFNSWVAFIVLIAADYMAIVAALVCAYHLRADVLPRVFVRLEPLYVPDLYLIGTLPVIYLILLGYGKLYEKRLPFWESAGAIGRVSFFATVLIAGVLYFSGSAHAVSRVFILSCGLFSFLFLACTRYVMKQLLIQVGLWKKPIIIVGAGKTAELLVQAFQETPALGYQVEGIIEDYHASRPLTSRIPLLGGFSDIEQIMSWRQVDDVLLATPGLSREKIVELVYRIQPYVKSIFVVPDLFEIPMGDVEVNTFVKEKTILLRIKNNLANPGNQLIKRIFDLILSVSGAVILAPVFIVLAALIRWDSPGPAFYVAARLGKGGKSFNCYKFRTMHLRSDELLSAYLQENPQAQEEWDRYFKLRGYDPRVTRLGARLRKSSLDELPLLFNVVLGDMSLVGPRPYLPREITRMRKYADIIREVAPGITGLWQVSGRNDIDFDGRLRIDSWYIRSWSLWRDIGLLIKTAEVVLRRKGAY